MYRAVTLFAIRNACIIDNEVNIARLISLLDNIQLQFILDENNQPIIHLNGENVETLIRQPETSSFVSKVAAIPEVRKKLVDEQRRMGKQGGIVMDGRDIGSVVFPDAELKLFVTADIETRTQRRYKELQLKNVFVTIDEVRENLKERDQLDSSRAVSPLVQAEDAILLDNTNLTPEGQLDKAIQLVNKIISK